METLMDNIFILVFAAFFVFVLYSMFSKRGKGMMLGGEIVDTATSEIDQSSGMLSTKIRAHVIRSKTGNKHIGIEISENAKLGASMKPLKLTKREAEKLIGMLNEVVSKT